MADQKNFVIKNIDEIQSVAEFLCNFFLPTTIFLFDGEMASGKTTLISAILKIQKFNDVSSPTYAFHNQYVLCTNQKVHHLDLHRTENSDDLETLGLWDLFEQNSYDIFFIEWAQRLNIKNLPMNFKIIRINIIKNDLSDREFKITF